MADKKDQTGLEVVEVDARAESDDAELSLDDINVYGDDPNFKPGYAGWFFGQIWDSFLKPPNERKYIQKLDGYILIYSLLSYGLKSLDVSNVSNAYVSGMKEDIYAIRFLLGLFESSSYPGFAYILGCWYGPDELAKRMGVYDCAGYMANMVAGYIQAGIYAGLNGACGIAGWRWMFIIDGIIGFPIALWGYYSIPDFPNNTRARWLTAKDREISLVRMKVLGKKEPRRLTVRRFYDMFFRSWRPWPFLVSYTMLWISGTSGYFNLWLKSLQMFTVEEINIIPTGGYALGLVSGFFFANMSDRTQSRWPWLFAATFFRFLGSLLLAVWNLPMGVIFFANLCNYIGEPVWSLLITWSAECFSDDAELRGLLTAVGNSIGSAFSMWIPIVIFPTYQAPHYDFGYIVTTCFDVVDFFALLAFLYLARREQKKRNLNVNRFGYAVDRNDYLQGLSEVRAQRGIVSEAPDAVDDKSKPNEGEI